MKLRWTTSNRSILEWELSLAAGWLSAAYKKPERVRCTVHHSCQRHSEGDYCPLPWILITNTFHWRSPLLANYECQPQLQIELGRHRPRVHALADAGGWACMPEVTIECNLSKTGHLYICVFTDHWTGWGTRQCTGSRFYLPQSSPLDFGLTRWNHAYIQGKFGWMLLLQVEHFWRFMWTMYS